MAKKKKKEDMTFLEHLEELRWHLIRAVLAVTVFSIIAFIFDDFIFNKILLAPKNPNFITNQVLCHLATVLNKPELCINTKPLPIINTMMSGQFQADMWISFIAGIILAFPFIINEIWKFISPALYVNERNQARGAVLAISGLFLIGVLFGYYVIVPLSIHFLGTYSVSSQIQNYINLNSYFSTIASATLACGLVFELPIFAFFLAKIGVISAAFMRKYRRHAIIIILIIAAIITPPDVFSQIMVTIPLILLYEMSIFVVVIVQRKKLKNTSES